LKTFVQLLLVALFSCGFLLSLGCEAGAEEQPVAADRDEAPDPMRSCRERLDGTWRQQEFEAKFDSKGGTAILSWQGMVRVFAVAFTQCDDDTATLASEGFTVTVRFKNAKKIVVRNADYPPLTLHKDED